jgi:hypothetical protein
VSCDDTIFCLRPTTGREGDRRWTASVVPGPCCSAPQMCSPCHAGYGAALPVCVAEEATEGRKVRLATHLPGRITAARMALLCGRV